MRAIHSRFETMRFLAVSIALVSVLTLTGASAYGPVREPNYIGLATAALPPDSGEVLMFGRGYWAPDANGFTDIRSQPTPMLGLLLITTKGIYFQQWLKPESRYDTMGRILFSEMDSVRIAEFGRSLRVVLKKKDLSATSFAYSGQKGEFVDKEKTRQAFDAVRSHTEGSLVN